MEKQYSMTQGSGCRDRHPCHGRKAHTSGHRGQGPSSFWMQDPKEVFHALALSPGDRVLDIGCGAGDYALDAARIVGAAGLVAAVDHWPPTVQALDAAARAEQLPQVQALQGDITRPPLPVKDHGMDCCLIFTVLHILDLSVHGRGLYREVARILKDEGRLAVMECKKEEMSFGPPVHMRLSPDQVEDSIRGMGFEKTGYWDLGYNYLLEFTYKG